MKPAAFVGAAALAAVTLAGCASGAGGSDEGANIVYVVPSSWTEVGAFADHVKAWEEKTGNTVEIQGIPDEQYDDTVRARLQGGEGIDIYAGQDNVEDPSSIMLEIDESEFASRMDPSVLDSMRAADSKIYGYPAADGLASFGVFYNEDVFAATGLDVPTTLEELTADFDALKAAGVTPLFLAGADGWTLLQHRNAADANFLGDDPDVAADLASNKTTWSKVPGALPQYEALAKWVAAGDVNADALTAKYEESLKALADGTTGAIINGSWIIGATREQNPDVNLGFFALPTEDGSNSIALSRPNILHIAAASEVADEAADLLTFLIEPENVAEHLAKAPGIPPFTDVTLEGADPVIEDIQAYVADGAAVRHFDNATTFPTPQDDIIAAYQELVAGRIDATAFLAKVDEAWANAGKTAGIEGF